MDRRRQRENEVLAVRAYNNCLLALDVLYESSLEGSASATEMLRSESDRLIRLAGNEATAHDLIGGANLHPPRAEVN
jgi:hypothetical protein